LIARQEKKNLPFKEGARCQKTTGNLNKSPGGPLPSSAETIAVFSTAAE
jgi:hypothetical protein